MTLRAASAFAVLAVLAATAATDSADAAGAGDRAVLGDGGWSWFGDPRAIYHDGRFRRTYVGWIDRGGDVKVASYDHDSGRLRTAGLRRDLGRDDHNNPSLLIRPDGRIMAFYSVHSGPRMYYRVSTRREDISAWGPTRTIPTNTRGPEGYTYPNPLLLEGRIYLFWRGGNWQPSFAASSDGRTWSRARTLIRMRGQRPYVKYASDGKRTVHLAFTEGHPGALHTSIYYSRYRSGALYRADGRRIGSRAGLPIAPRRAERVYDARGRSRAWVHDIAVDRRGRAVVVYATFPSHGNHRYHYARWTGRRWVNHFMTPAGGSISSRDEPYYSGGITLDHEDPSVVYLSRQVRGVHEIERWTTANGGSDWSRQAITSRSRTSNVRPLSPRGFSGGQLDVLWMRGRYGHWTTYDTFINTLLASASTPSGSPQGSNR